MIKTETIHAGWLEKWPAPAKLNLMLRITGQREDGYHLLQTVIQPLDWCDWLKFYPLDGDVVYLKTPLANVPETTNLMLRAAKLLKTASGYSHGVSIEIEKNLPMGGGLGGGSSDAATTLLVLNKLWNIGFSIEKLMQLGLQLGADVPVFVYGHCAWVEGVGEKVTRILLPEQWVVIIKPPCHVSTSEIFLNQHLTRDSKIITMASFFTGELQKNDCLAVVCKLYHPVEQALIALSEFSKAKLTGSGACVFAQFTSYELACKAYNALKSDWQIYLSKSMNESLLSKKLALF